MKRADYELIAKVIKNAKEMSRRAKGLLFMDFYDQLAQNGNFHADKFRKDCGLGGG